MQAAEAITAMDRGRFRDTMDGRGVFLACLAGAKREFLLPLYERPTIQGMRGTRDFEILIGQIVNACSPELHRHASPQSLRFIGLLVRELFENTNDHAHSDVFGRNYNWDYPNPRAILAKFIAIDSYAIESERLFEGDAQQNLFLTRAILDKPDGPRNRNSASVGSTTKFLEVSVIDGGPGIARRWLAHKRRGVENTNELSAEEEEQLVRVCWFSGNRTFGLRFLVSIRTDRSVGDCDPGHPTW
ncbi:MAG: hypothetical protein ACRESZ_10980 [Methylococcales bacterium]